MMQSELVSNLKPKIEALPQDVLMNRILGGVLEEGQALALWRMPNQSKSRLFVDFQTDRIFDLNVLEDYKPGFVFAPFMKDKGLIIMGELSIQLDHNSNEIVTSATNSESLLWLDKIIEKEQELSIESIASEASTSDSNYKEWVTQAVSKISNREFKKVVPARILIKPWNQDPIRTYLALTKKYPNAFVSLTYSPTAGFWIGATPELLLNVSKEKIFTTSSLAGTKPYEQGMPLHNVTWTQKEIEEQAMVSRYIINCFKTIRLREFEEEGPRTVKAGNLVHLRTDFRVDMVATNFPNLGSTMLELLHPTSAICGMPKEPALSFIEETENFEREYFSGYLGPVNVEEETSIYVNIRCARLYNKKAAIFAGAGVTSYSDPDSEWAETELKCQTLLDVMS